MRALVWMALCVMLIAAAATPAAAGPMFDPFAAARPDKLVVGTVPIAPFIIKHDDGTWGGISMDLWKEIARKLDYRYEVRELTVADLADPDKLAQLDVFVSFNVTAEREKTLDLTHAFYSTGLAIAVAPHDDGGLVATLRAIFTPKFGKLIAALFALLAVIGALMWLAERRRNEQFGGTAAHGIGAGLWWSAVTMTTVGYGDKSPITLPGRLLGLVWMFAAILMISSFTASISSALTVDQLASAVAGPGDLPKVKVGAVEASSGAAYLARRHVAAHAYKDLSAALAALASGEVEAIVYEAPILQYAVKARPDAGVVVLDGTFDNHGYALALRQGSPLREEINLALLEYIATDDWSAVLARYLGSS